MCSVAPFPTFDVCSLTTHISKQGVFAPALAAEAVGRRPQVATVCVCSALFLFLSRLPLKERDYFFSAATLTAKLTMHTAVLMVYPCYTLSLSLCPVQFSSD